MAVDRNVGRFINHVIAAEKNCLLREQPRATYLRPIAGIVRRRTYQIRRYVARVQSSVVDAGSRENASGVPVYFSVGSEIHRPLLPPVTHFILSRAYIYTLMNQI